jgi:hypothetical protein
VSGGWIVAHEIAHRYWGFNKIIDDGDFCHWPGLALGIYSDQLDQFSFFFASVLFGYVRGYFVIAFHGKQMIVGIFMLVHKPDIRIRQLP